MSHRALRVLALGAVVGAMALTIPRFLTHTPYQRLGVRLEWNAPNQYGRVRAAFGPPGEGLLLKDDLILAIDGEPFTPRILFGQEKGAGRKMLDRGPLELLIERQGRRLTVTVPPLQLSAWQRARLYALPLVTLVAAPLVAFLVVWRRPDLSTAWVFLLFAILQAVGTIWGLFRFPQGELSPGLRWYVEMYHAMVMFLPASFLHFMTVFPRPRWAGRPPRSSPWFWIVVAAYLTPVVLIVSEFLFHTPTDALYQVFQVIAIPLGSLSLIEHYVRASRTGDAPSPRERALALIVAVILTMASVQELVPEDARMEALLSLPAVRLFTTALFFAWLCTPFLIAWLIANDPAFDPRRIVVRTLPYALLTGALATLYLGIVLLGQRVFAAVTGEESFAFNVVAALIVAFAVAPMRERIQGWLDRIYGRDPLALRHALDQGAHDLLGALDRNEVRGAVEAAIERGLRRPVAIEWPESGMPRIAESLREEDQGALDALLVQAGIRLENLSLHEQRAAAERRAAELREAAMHAELRALHAQVQPHFLFNALNALAYLTETDPKAAQRFTERLAGMLRYTVQAGDRTTALLSDEIGFVEDYLGVARERYENPLSFEYHGAPELLSTAVPPLLLQPLVENSLKHGCTPGERPLHLELDARCESGWLTLEFRDDGGPAGNGAPGLGVGLDNLAQRVRRFAGSESVLTATRRDSGGFAVTMRWRVPGMVATNGANGRNGA